MKRSRLLDQQRAVRDHLIRETFKAGVAIEAICREVGLSPTRVRAIVGYKPQHIPVQLVTKPWGGGLALQPEDVLGSRQNIHSIMKAGTARLPALS
jgi:hypothetical protein